VCGKRGYPFTLPDNEHGKTLYHGRVWAIGKTVLFHGETMSSILRSNFYLNSTSINFGYSNELIFFIGHGYGYGVASSRIHTLRVPS
jgi:hypothetical protein